MDTVLELYREPKTLTLEKRDDGSYRLVIVLRKLGVASAMEYFLDTEEARVLAQALSS